MLEGDGRFGRSGRERHAQLSEGGLAVEHALLEEADGSELHVVVRGPRRAQPQIAQHLDRVLTVKAAGTTLRHGAKATRGAEWVARDSNPEPAD